MPSRRNARQLLGTQGEKRAAEALQAAGYVIVASDVRVGRLQIDHVAEEGGDLVFVKTKYKYV
jgi:Holliday junction resolvase-like predicted endonuclease